MVTVTVSLTVVDVDALQMVASIIANNTANYACAWLLPTNAGGGVGAAVDVDVAIAITADNDANVLLKIIVIKLQHNVGAIKIWMKIILQLKPLTVELEFLMHPQQTMYGVRCWFPCNMDIQIFYITTTTIRTTTKAFYLIENEGKNERKDEDFYFIYCIYSFIYV